jgi:hypothetical protein
MTDEELGRAMFREYFSLSDEPAIQSIRKDWPSLAAIARRLLTDPTTRTRAQIEAARNEATRKTDCWGQNNDDPCTCPACRMFRELYPPIEKFDEDKPNSGDAAKGA